MEEQAAHNTLLKTLVAEFREFAIKGSVVDMAVGIIIGGAFGTIVKSLVEDVIMPPIGLLLGGVDFKDQFLILSQGDPIGPYETVEIAQATGAVTLNYGLFINSVVSFLIVAAAVFFLVRAINRLRREDEKSEPAASKKCPFCVSKIPAEASRCPSCTSQLQAGEPTTENS